MNISVQSNIILVVANSANPSGMFLRTNSCDGKGKRSLSSKYNKLIQVINILDTRLVLTPNLSARSCTNNPAFSCINTKRNSSRNVNFLVGPGLFLFSSS